VSTNPRVPLRDAREGRWSLLHRDPQALLPSAKKYAYDKNRYDSKRRSEAGKAEEYERQGRSGHCVGCGDTWDDAAGATHSADQKVWKSDDVTLSHNSSIGVAMRFRKPPRVNDRTIARLADGLCVPPDGARLEVVGTRRPYPSTLSELSL